MTKNSLVPITTALLSVSDKTGLDRLGRALAKHGVHILSTGGSAQALRAAKLEVTDISDYTGFPEIMDGRVKTLHPLVHGGILGKRTSPAHQKAMQDHAIQPIDLLVVNLYPFSETIEKTDDLETCIENIDIGGPALIRAAAKNHAFVAVVTSPAQYNALIDALEMYDGALPESLLRQFAVAAFAVTSSYDQAITNWMEKTYDKTDGEKESTPENISLNLKRVKSLRYGENPQQAAALYSFDSTSKNGLVDATQLQGKPLSYNNYNDAEAGYLLAGELSLQDNPPAVVIIKHANPCGVAICPPETAQAKDPDSGLLYAWKRALACDPVSAFGGVVVVNRPIGATLARQLQTLFLEVLIAPDYTPEALDILSQKPNLRALKADPLTNYQNHKNQNGIDYRSLSNGGMLIQQADFQQVTADDLQCVTIRQPDIQEISDMLFAWKVAKHVKSNAIVLARDGMTLGIGPGQSSRVESARIALSKANSVLAHPDNGEIVTKQSHKMLVSASDAFFPFADGVEVLAKGGCLGFIQPGGSLRDNEVIAASDEAGAVMVFTGQRHFRH